MTISPIITPNKTPQTKELFVFLSQYNLPTVQSWRQWMA